MAGSLDVASLSSAKFSQAPLAKSVTGPPIKTLQNHWCQFIYFFDLQDVEGFLARRPRLVAVDRRVQALPKS